MKQTVKNFRLCEAIQAAVQLWKAFLQLMQVDKDEEMSEKKFTSGIK